MSNTIVYLVERVKTVLQQHVAEEQRIINSLNQILEDFGIKPKTTQPTVPKTTETSVTIVTQDLSSLEKSIENLNKTTEKLVNILTSIEKVLSTGTKFSSFTKMYSVRLDGSKGLTYQGQKFVFHKPTDYIIVIPTVEAIVNFNSDDLGDHIPPIYANGLFAGYIRANYISYRASSAVPASVLPAPMYLWYFYYE